MIDTGANRTFISLQALSALQIQQIVQGEQESASLADGSTSLPVLGTLKLSVVISDISISMTTCVVRNLCIELILGMDFIQQYELILDVGKRVVSLCDRGRRITLRLNSDREDVCGSTRPVYATPITIGGLTLGTTTVPTLSLSKSSSVNQQLVNNHIMKLTRHLSDTMQHDKVTAILRQHTQLLDTSRPAVAINVKPHEIKTHDHPPPSSRPYRSTPQKEEEMYKITQDLLYHGLIRKSYSPYAAPALLVPKSDGSWRMVVDYKKLNNITIKDNHPLPHMEQTIQRLGGGYKFFSTLDMKSGFWQIPIKDEDKHKTAFITPDGLYEWNVLAQGLKNSPPSFQRVMVEILAPCRQFSLVYIDDIVVFSRSFDEHVDHMQQLLSILSTYNFQLNPSKCKLFQCQIDYLSHIISEDGFRPNNEKIKAIMNLREPSTLVEANKFLGGLAWYKKFIPRFSSIAAPIHKVTNLTKENRKKFRWEQPQHEAFLQLKQFLTTSPLFLDYPNDNYPLILTTDASKIGIGGTLQQNIEGEIKNLFYHSQVTSSTQRRYDPIEFEALAIWMCFQRMRQYLLGRSIIIYTDHCPLCNMMNSTVKNRRVDRISILLQEFNIEKIIHSKGQHNCLADYLSRHPIQEEQDIFDEDYGITLRKEREQPLKGCVPEGTVPLVGAVVTRSRAKQLEIERNRKTTTITPTTMKETSTLDIEEERDQCEHPLVQDIHKQGLDIERFKLEQRNDPFVQQKILEMEKYPNKCSYLLKDHLLYKLLAMRRNCSTKTKLIYVPSSMIGDLLEAYHSHPLGGHFGVLRTYLKIRNKFWWPEMKQSIIHYIRSCLPCQQFNVSRSKKPGRLQPIPPPEGPFQLIGMDYCGPLKRTPRGNQYVLCITDYFTRWIVAVAVPDCSAQTTAEALFNEFICKYGVPTVILTDQGTHFLNQLMEAMSKLVGYKHTYSTTYHPQSNGMIERFNATFIPQIAKLQDRENNNWDDYLSPVVFAYNTGCHSTTQYAPYELLFGREPRFPTDQSRTSFTFQRPNDYYEQLKKSMKIIHSHARENIIRKQRQYKTQYDKQRSDPHYAINDRVLIRRHGMKNKLEPKFSITPQIIVREEHPVYVVKDEITQSEARVHVNDIRPIYVEKSN